MKVSVQLANKYSNVDLLSLDTNELLQKIGAQLGAVEEVIDWGVRYHGAVVVKIVSCTKHADADKLNVCLIDDGNVVQDVERNSEGLVQVVCGAPNVRQGLTVVWLPPGSTVPSTFDKDPFVLGARELRGVLSNGMLASPRELSMSEDHEGILEVEVEEVKPGTPFVDLYGLRDTIIDCENKMFTHRPDCFGTLGVAREFAGIYGQSFESPDWYSLAAVSKNNPTGTLPLVSQNPIIEKVPRFMAQVIEGVTVGPSPVHIQSTLTRLGSRPINNLVDATNYMMFVTAQPTHAFDYDKVKALCGDQVTIFPRMANDGEELKLLNGKTVKLTSSDIVISTDKQAIALGGVMGGADTEVDQNTKNIIVECANFDMYTIRRTSMRHGIFSDAVTRFTKGQSYLQNPVVLQKLVSEICQQSGAEAGAIFDSAPEEDSFTRTPVVLKADFINSRLGSNLTIQEIQSLLDNVEFTVDVNESDITITPPFWRTDIELPEDIVEEVGRLYGYDKLPVVLPARSSAPVSKNPSLELSNKLRETLSTAGANEVLTYSFVSGQLIETAEQNTDEAYQLSNALSPELQYYRLTLTPSLLGKVHSNIKSGIDQFAIFEIGRTHLKLQGVNEEGLPHENAMLSLVYTENDKRVAKDAGAAYFEAKRYLDHVAQSLGLTLDYEVLNEDVKYEITKPFQSGRSALVTDRKSGNYIGVIGEFKSSVRRKLKLPNHTAGFEIMLQPLLESKQAFNYQVLSKFPGTTQDVTLSAPVELSYETVSSSLEKGAQELTEAQGYRTSIKPVSIYQKDKAKSRNYTFRISIEKLERTLTTDEATKFVDSVVEAVTKDTGAKRV